MSEKVNKLKNKIKM